MLEESYKYVIIGGGLAGASAAEGIREIDREGSILLLAAEKHVPYIRPPLSKGLWTGKKKLADIFVHDNSFYDRSQIKLGIGVEATSIDPRARDVLDCKGNRYGYEKLLIATGGHPRKLDIDGGSFEGVSYYRTITDFGMTCALANPGATATVIGGGFIGTEMAAAMNLNGVKVTMLFFGEQFTDNVFPQDLGEALMKHYESKGIEVHPNQEAKAISGNRGRFIVETKQGLKVESDILIVGVGIQPEIMLAQGAGLKVGNGIEVDELLRTSNPDIYAAGDNANFPYQALGKRARVEHWDNALNQGKLAGRNMAGADEQYSYMPYFYSDLFEFGYEAVGDVSSKLEMFEDWQEPYEKGVIYYLEENRVRGIMTCNVWDKMPVARQMIKSGNKVTRDDLRGAIK